MRKMTFSNYWNIFKNEWHNAIADSIIIFAAVLLVGEISVFFASHFQLGMVVSFLVIFGIIGALQLVFTFILAIIFTISSIRGAKQYYKNLK